MEDKEVFNIAVPSTISSSKSLEKCVICQKIKDNKGDTKLTSTVKGRNVILECSAILKDNLLDGIENEENIKYHVNTCYARYVSSKRRAEKRTSVLQECNSVSENAGEPSEPLPSTTRPKRRKSKDEENILSEPRNNLAVSAIA